MISLLAEALRLGPAGDIKKLDERLAEMYGAVFETAVIKKGGCELLTLNMEVIKDENAGEKVFKNAASLMREIIGGRIVDKAFRQAKVLISPMTPPNYELEKAIDMVLDDIGVKRAKSKRSAEARAPKKKPNTLGRKSAANEELSVVPSKKRKRKRKKSGKRDVPVQMRTARTMAEEHDL